MNECTGKLKIPFAKRYMPGIDGLRAISVLAVIAYHLNLKWAAGGLLGVGIFFVISGYLITDGIILEWKNGNLHLPKFWIRRIRRLMPAMVVMLALVAIWLLWIDPNRLAAIKGEFISSLFYVNNWWLIYHEVSYFEIFGPPSPIGHLWSLAIEEQFYLLWPIILYIMLKIGTSRRRLLIGIIGGAAVSVIAMALIYKPGIDPSRVYYGTDTRAFALLIGAALAIVWPSWRLKPKVNAKARRVLDILGLFSLGMTLLLIITTNKYSDWLYRGGFLYLALVTAIVIAVLAHPASLTGRVVGGKLLCWIGKRSYSLYLWHFPVIVLSSPLGSTEAPGIMRVLLQLGASFLLASFSYKYIEVPLRGGKPNKEEPQAHYKRRLKRSYYLLGLLFVFLISLLWSASLDKR